jgi:hypothetical protein
MLKIAYDCLFTGKSDIARYAAIHPEHGTRSWPIIIIIIVLTSIFPMPGISAFAQVGRCLRCRGFIVARKFYGPDALPDVQPAI